MASIMAMGYGLWFGIATSKYGGKHSLLMFFAGVGFYLFGVWVGWSL